MKIIQAWDRSTNLDIWTFILFDLSDIIKAESVNSQVTDEKSHCFTWVFLLFFSHRFQIILCKSKAKLFGFWVLNPFKIISDLNLTRGISNVRKQLNEILMTIVHSKNKGRIFDMKSFSQEVNKRNHISL